MLSKVIYEELIGFVKFFKLICLKRYINYFFDVCGVTIIIP